MSDPRVRARAQARAAVLDAADSRVDRYRREPSYRVEVEALIDGFLQAVASLDETAL